MLVGTNEELRVSVGSNALVSLDLSFKALLRLCHEKSNVKAAGQLVKKLSEFAESEADDGVPAASLAVLFLDVKPSEYLGSEAKPL